MKLGIILPVYNDWEPLEKLTGLIKKELGGHSLLFIVVNDGSDTPPPDSLISSEDTCIIELARNIGHQKAIAAALGWAAENISCDAAIVMDSDGEDSPGDIPRLLEKFSETGNIVFARRRSRKETLSFRILYRVYRLIFYLFVGKPINFGNFSVIPGGQLKRLAHVSEIWNHYPGGVIRSKIPYSSVPADRAKRLGGKSKMGLVNLIIHGISSITVNLDIVTARLLIFFSFTAALLFILLLLIFFIRFFTGLAVPGWATYTVTGILILITQSLLIFLTLSFNVLFRRTLNLFIPAYDYPRYVLKVIKPSGGKGCENALLRK